MNTYTAPAARVGSKWTPGYRPAREIAAEIRRDLKAAQRDGSIPADLKISVRVHNYAGGRSINVILTGWEDARIYAQRESLAQAHGYTTEALEVYRRVEGIRESYNRDASDAMVDYWDVDYYGTTSWKF